MRRLLLSLVALVFAFTFFAGAGKATAGEGDVYGGVKAGLAFVDADVDVDDLMMIGFLLGLGITPEISLEGELNVSVAGGDFDIGPFSGEADIWTVAGYAAYRAPLSEEAFLKAKIGLLFEDVELSVSGWPSESDTEFNLSAGIGAGVYFNEQLFGEVEFTIIEEDVTYLSLGLNYIF